ncbi:hypothetical protein MANES_12G094601v8 [Manihot esculenta]|uniref:Uncharacterized protein n=1 Tax=Manihot esculenta TaxID=3983 RepID=A0ACB7GQH3_MANES|nr:hypothetical protein MANES_12G094601v8 [Manihot esculenta]
MIAVNTINTTEINKKNRSSFDKILINNSNMNKERAILNHCDCNKIFSSYSNTFSHTFSHTYRAYSKHIYIPKRVKDSPNKKTIVLGLHEKQNIWRKRVVGPS